MGRYDFWDNAGIPFVFGATGNEEGSNGAKPNWDGVFEGVPQSGGYVGLSPFSDDVQADRINARRPLAKSAGEMAGSDGILWMSMIVHFDDARFFFAPGLVLSAGGGFEERVLLLSDFSNGIGIGNGGPPINDGRNATDVTISHYVDGIRDETTKRNVLNLNTTIADYLIVFKYQFGVESDSLSVAVFDETDVITEAEFVERAETMITNIDEGSLDTLAVGLTRAGNAYDELRIGDTFTDVVSGVLEEPSVLTLAISSTAGGFEFRWPSREGKIYDLLGSEDLAIPAENWEVWNGHEGMGPTPPMNTLSEVVSEDGKRFFVIRERNVPAILVEPED